MCIGVTSLRTNILKDSEIAFHIDNKTMKGAVLALFCAVALVSAELNENGCPINPYVDILKPHPICNKYYQCVQGNLVVRKCASDLSFNVETQECDWAANVDCGNRPVIPDSSEESGNDSNANGDSSSEESGSNSSSDESGNDNDNNNNGNGNGNPEQARDICAAEGSDGVLVAHENCNQFYKCSDGVPVALDCQLNLLYNYKTEQCDWPENVDCKGRNQGGDGDNNNDNNSGKGDADTDDGENDNNDNNNSGNGNGDSSHARDICAAEGSDGVLVAHKNCNQFYKCSEGVPVTLECQLNLLYNYKTEQCDWPENVDCKDRNQGGNGDDGNDNNGGNGDADEDGEADNEDGENNNNGGGNSDPSQANDICAREDSDSILVAHEICNHYYVCQDGLPVTLNCNPYLVFNPATNECDWPEKVDCGTRRTFISLNKHMRGVQ